MWVVAGCRQIDNESGCQFAQHAPARRQPAKDDVTRWDALAVCDAKRITALAANRQAPSPLAAAPEHMRGATAASGFFDLVQCGCQLGRQNRFGGMVAEIEAVRPCQDRVPPLCEE